MEKFYSTTELQKAKELYDAWGGSKNCWGFGKWIDTKIDEQTERICYLKIKYYSAQDLSETLRKDMKNAIGEQVLINDITAGVEIVDGYEDKRMPDEYIRHFMKEQTGYSEEYIEQQLRKYKRLHNC